MAYGITFSQAEDEVIDKLKLVFYQSTASDDIKQQIKDILSSVDKNSRNELCQAAIEQVSYELVERKNYIIKILFGSVNPPSKPDDELLIRSIGLNQDLRQPLADFGLDASIINKIGSKDQAEILKQAEIYTAISSKLDRFSADILSEQRFLTVYGSMKGLADQDLENIIINIKSFFSTIRPQDNGLIEVRAFNIPLAIEDLMKKYSLSIIFDRYLSFQEKTTFLADLLIICQAIIDNRRRSNPLNDQVVINSLGLWSHYQKNPIDYQVL